MARTVLTSNTCASEECGDLIRVLLNARSTIEANLALALLRPSVADGDIVALANLRELLTELPVPPLRTAYELDLLARALGYEQVRGAYRQAFDSDAGVFGLEFLGEGNCVESVVVLTVAGRAELACGDEEIIASAAIEMLLRYPEMVDRLVEALVALGVEVHPRFYLSISDYVLENATGSYCSPNT